MADQFNLHGGATRKSPIALLLIDVINDMEFEEGHSLLKQALPAARKIAALKKRAQDAGIPVIYVNDNFGRWQSDFKKLVQHCLRDGVCSEPVARLLAPEDDDYFVLKPKSSAFFDTTLDTLLRHLGVKTLILTGFAADVCILFTAHDAHLRDYNIIVPADCIASNTRRETSLALRNIFKATRSMVCNSEAVDLRRLRSGTRMIQEDQAA